MYNSGNYVTSLDDIAKALGIGRNKALFLCQTKPHCFPVVKIGRKYQADKAMLEEWRQDWYKGKFEITFGKE